MHLLSVVLLYYTISCIIANDITILTDWDKTTLQCMSNFFENGRYFSKYDINATISGLDEKKGKHIFELSILLSYNLKYVSKFSYN